MIGMNVPYNFGGRTIPDRRHHPQLRRARHQRRGVADAAGRSVSRRAGEPRGRWTRRGGEQDAAQKASAEELRKWRLSVAMDKVQPLRKKFEDAGILVEIVKVDGILTMPDEVVDYEFQLAKALGARAISTEITVAETERLGRFADKHKMMVGYHGHATTTAADFETVFGYAAHNGANLDIGHFVAGQNTSPVPFITKHHSRITHIHVKDRKMNNGRERAVWSGGHSHQRGAAAHPRQQVEHPGDDRVRVSGARRLEPHGRNQEEHRLLPRRARVGRSRRMADNRQNAVPRRCNALAGGRPRIVRAGAKAGIGRIGAKGGLFTIGRRYEPRACVTSGRSSRSIRATLRATRSRPSNISRRS